MSDTTFQYYILIQFLVLGPILFKKIVFFFFGLHHILVCSPPSLPPFFLPLIKSDNKLLERLLNLFIHPHVKAFLHSTPVLTSCHQSWRQEVLGEDGAWDGPPAGGPKGSSPDHSPTEKGGCCGLPGLRGAGQGPH